MSGDINSFGRLMDQLIPRKRWHEAPVHLQREAERILAGGGLPAIGRDPVVGWFLVNGVLMLTCPL